MTEIDKARLDAALDMLKKIKDPCADSRLPQIIEELETILEKETTH